MGYIEEQHLCMVQRDTGNNLKLRKETKDDDAEVDLWSHEER